MSEATQTVAAGQLRSVIERIERRELDKQECADDIKAIKAEAKGTGFSVPTINAILKLRKKDQAEREEAEALLDTYLAALGMLPQGDLFNATPIPSQDGKTESEGLASAPVTEHEQARFPSQGALEAGPVAISSLGAGPADPFNDTGPHVFSDQEPS